MFYWDKVNYAFWMAIIQLRHLYLSSALLINRNCWVLIKAKVHEYLICSFSCELDLLIPHPHHPDEKVNWNSLIRIWIIELRKLNWVAVGWGRWRLKLERGNSFAHFTRELANSDSDLQSYNHFHFALVDCNFAAPYSGLARKVQLPLLDELNTFFCSNC